MNKDQEATLREIFAIILNIPNIELRDDLTADQVPGWDSFNHINILLQTEQAFGIRFDSGEIADLKNIGELKKLIASKLG